MIGACISKGISHMRALTLLRHYYTSSSHSPCSLTTLPGFKTASLANCIKSIPIGVFWIWPWFQSFDSTNANHKSFSTEASPSNDTHDEVLNQIQPDNKFTLSFSENCEAQIDRLCSAGDLGTAFRLVQSAHDKEAILSLHTYYLLLEAAAEKDDFEILSQIFKYLLVSSDSVPPKFFLPVAKAFAKMDDDVFLLEFVKEISELMFPLHVAIMNKMIYAFGDYRQVGKALFIFEHMKMLKCEADLVTHNTILLILGRCGRVDDMLHHFASMKKANILPDVISYNTILNSVRKVGRLDICLTIFKEMGEQGVEPDLRTYTELIDIYGKSGNTEDALRLFDEMKHQRICPSIYVYRSLIQCLKKMGKLKLAAQLSKEMEERLSYLVGPKNFKKKRR